MKYYFFPFDFGQFLIIPNYLIFSWQKDPLCEDTPYPKVFDEFRKTLSNCRKQKYGKAPTNGQEILAEFEKEYVSEAYAFSILKDHGPFFNDVVITDTFENCIFSSSKSIDLILQNTTEEERFFVVDNLPHHPERSLAASVNEC